MTVCVYQLADLRGSVSIALTIGICLGAAGFHLYLAIKEHVTHVKEDMANAFSF